MKIRTRHFRRLGPIDLEIPAGQHMAVLGGRAAGKTTLLRIIAGLETNWKGSVYWDGLRTSLLNPSSAACAFLPDLPAWPRISLREHLNLRVSDDTSDDFTRRVFALCEVDKLVGRLSRGLDTKLRGAALSLGERRAMTLARTLLSKASVLLLDDPFVEQRAGKRQELVTSVLEIAGQSTVLVALNRPTDLASFDRVVVLKRGRIVFDGAPEAWRSRSARKDASSVPTSLPGELPPHETRGVRSCKQALILAAGQGSRLNGGNGLPKCLTAIGNGTLIEHQIENLRRIGVEQIAVVVGYRRNDIQQTLQNRVHYINNADYATTNSLYSLWLARRWVVGGFILLNGDVMAPAEFFTRLDTVMGDALTFDSSSGTEPEHMKVYSVNGLLRSM